MPRGRLSRVSPASLSLLASSNSFSLSEKGKDRQSDEKRGPESREQRRGWRDGRWEKDVESFLFFVKGRWWWLRGGEERGKERRANLVQWRRWPAAPLSGVCYVQVCARRIVSGESCEVGERRRKAGSADVEFDLDASRLPL